MTVKNITINEDIVLDPKQIKGMSEDLQGHLKVAITNAAETFKCDWKDIIWKVGFDKASRRPYISTKRRKEAG